MFLMPSGKGPRKRGGRNRGQGRNKDRPWGPWDPGVFSQSLGESVTLDPGQGCWGWWRWRRWWRLKQSPDRSRPMAWGSLMGASWCFSYAYDILWPYIILYDSVFHVLEIPWPCDLLDELPDGSGMPGLCVSKHCRLGYFRLLDSWHHFRCFYSIQFVFSHHIFRCNCPESGGHSWALRMWHR